MLVEMPGHIRKAGQHGTTMLAATVIGPVSDLPAMPISAFSGVAADGTRPDGLAAPTGRWANRVVAVTAGNVPASGGNGVTGRGPAHSFATHHPARRSAATRRRAAFSCLRE